MAFSKEVLIKQREIAMQKGYLTKSERETFEKYIGQSKETNPTHIKSSNNTASKIYTTVSKKEINEYNPTGGREVVGYQIDKEDNLSDPYDLSGGFNDVVDSIGGGSIPTGGSGKYIMYGLGLFIIMGIFGN